VEQEKDFNDELCQHIYEKYNNNKKYLFKKRINIKDYGPLQIIGLQEIFNNRRYYSNYDVNTNCVAYSIAT